MNTPTTYEETLTFCDKCDTPIKFITSQEHYGKCACSRWRRAEKKYGWGEWEFAEYKEDYK